MRGGNQAIAGRAGVSGFQAIDRWVAKQQHIAVAVVGCRRSLVPVFFQGVVGHVVGKILHQAGRQQGQVPRRGAVPHLGQALGVFIGRGLHAKRQRLVVHELHKTLGAAAYTLGQGHGGVIAALDNHALDQVFHRHHHLRVDEHARTRHLPGALADRECLLEVNLFALQGLKHQVGGHQLGERRRFDRHIDVFLRQHLVGGDIEQQVAAGCYFGRLWHLSRGLKSNCCKDSKENFFHGCFSNARRAGNFSGRPLGRGQHCNKYQRPKCAGTNRRSTT